MSEDKELGRLIILGAGASVECGVYPTGLQLIELAKKVSKILENDQMLIEFYGDDQYQKNKYNLKNLKDYLDNLVRTNYSSIDTHIALIDNENEQKFLKSFLFSTIIASTAYSQFMDKFENNWYPELSKLIFPVLSSEDNDETKIKEIKEKLKFIQIITFNYDVSLEIYLLERAKQYFKTTEKCFAAFDLICEKIFHVYGQILSAKEIKQTLESFQEKALIMIDDWKKVFADKVCDLNLISNADKLEINFGGKKILNIGDGVKIPRQDKINYQKYKSSIVFEPVSYDEFLKDYKNKFYKDFSEIIEQNSNQSNIFCLMVMKYASIFYHSYSDSKTAFSPSRFDVINEQDRKKTEIKNEIAQRIFNKEPDSIWVIGFGFDIINTYELLELKNIKWKKSCFATNYGEILRIEREIYKNLSYSHQQNKKLYCWKIPNKISPKKCSIKSFLNDQYHFLDDVETKYKILEEWITPWHEM